MASLPFNATTVVDVLVGLARILWGIGQVQHTSVKVGLLGEFVIRVTVGVDRSIELLKSHERMHKLIVGVEQAS